MMLKKSQTFLDTVKRLKIKRGEFITETINLDVYIEESIASYFSKETEKRNELLEYFIREMNMDRKLKLFKYLVNTYRPKLNELFPNLHTDLEEIRIMRNKLAHRQFQLSLTPFEKGKIPFISKDGKQAILLESDIDLLLNKAKRYNFKFLWLSFGASSAT